MLMRCCVRVRGLAHSYEAMLHAGAWDLRASVSRRPGTQHQHQQHRAGQAGLGPGLEPAGLEPAGLEPAGLETQLGDSGSEEGIEKEEPVELGTGYRVQGEEEPVELGELDGALGIMEQLAPSGWQESSQAGRRAGGGQAGRQAERQAGIREWLTRSPLAQTFREPHGAVRSPNGWSSSRHPNRHPDEIHATRMELGRRGGSWRGGQGPGQGPAASGQRVGSRSQLASRGGSSRGSPSAFASASNSVFISGSHSHPHSYSSHSYSHSYSPISSSSITSSMVEDAQQDVAMLRSHGTRLVPTTGGVGKGEQAKAPGRGSPAYFAPQSEL